MSDRELPNLKHVVVETLFGAKSKCSIVQLSIDDRKIQISPAEARKIGEDLLEAAGAAETEEVLMRLLTKRVQMPFESAALILRDMRVERDLLKLDGLSFSSEPTDADGSK